MSYGKVTGGPLKQKGKSRLVAACWAITFGSLGAHKFYLGRKKAGIIQLAVAMGLCTIGMIFGSTGYIVMFSMAYVFAITEGILYATLSDAEFQRVYVDEGAEWLYLEGSIVLTSWRDACICVFALLEVACCALMVSMIFTGSLS